MRDLLESLRRRACRALGSGHEQPGHPASPEARRLHLTKAWAATSFHEDEDDDPEAIALAFADITVK
ncbi:hypothetical protein [Streptomyces sp. NPDC000961]|uniref:hypothetical protein n=1 Tax=Streptomyces sp. NPDC000961 TaxID=3364541 RepID=UPI0036AE7FA4